MVSAAAVLLATAAGAAAGTPRTVDYLAVEANEGDSSGGHAAIRFGDQTFHFQHERPGAIRLRRQSAAAFDYAYTQLGNRTIHERRIAVSEETYALLRDAFARRYLIQSAQFDQRDALRRDAALFEALARRVAGGTPEALPLRGLGFFLPDGDEAPAPAPVSTAPSPRSICGERARVRGSLGVQAVSPARHARQGLLARARFANAPRTAAEPLTPSLSPHRCGAREPCSKGEDLRSLRRRVEEAYGIGYLAARIASLRAAIGERELRAAAARAFVPDRFPAGEPTAAAHYADQLIGLFALEVLRAGLPLRAGTYWTPDAGEFDLDEREADRLHAFAERLADDLTRLLASSRPDWGFPFALGLARLAAIDRSLQTGRLVLLDAFPASAAAVPIDGATARGYLAAVEAETRAAFDRQRAVFFGTDAPREADYTALETAGNLLLEARRSRATGAPLRVHPGPLLPSRPARRGDIVVPRLTPAAAARERDAAREAERAAGAALARLYPYDLIGRNCVTEIFAVIDRALAELPAVREEAARSGDPVAAVRTESARRLGGYVDPSRGFAFIPFVSAAAVEQHYAVVAAGERLAYRRRRLAEMAGREPAWRVYLRESNTVTSTVYQPGFDDTSFLFFTDDAVAPRPLFGALNLAVGLGDSALGLLTLPLAGPHRLSAGLRGALFSLPELAFVNIRKGSMAYVDRRR